MTRTCWPAWRRPWSRSACRAVTADTGTAAACSKLRFAGIRASLSGRASAYSANAALLAAEHRLAGLESGHLRADRLDDARQLGAQAGGLRGAQAVAGDRIR